MPPNSFNLTKFCLPNEDEIKGKSFKWFLRGNHQGRNGVDLNLSLTHFHPVRSSLNMVQEEQGLGEIGCAIVNIIVETTPNPFDDEVSSRLPGDDRRDGKLCIAGRSLQRTACSAVVRN